MKRESGPRRSRGEARGKAEIALKAREGGPERTWAICTGRCGGHGQAKPGPHHRVAQEAGRLGRVAGFTSASSRGSCSSGKGELLPLDPGAVHQQHQQRRVTQRARRKPVQANTGTPQRALRISAAQRLVGGRALSRDHARRPTSADALCLRKAVSRLGEVEGRGDQGEKEADHAHTEGHRANADKAEGEDELSRRSRARCGATGWQAGG